MANFFKIQRIVFLVVICSCLLLPSLRAEDEDEEDDTSEWEEIDAVEVDAEVETGVDVESAEKQEPKVLGGGAININIQPVTSDELSCDGMPDGVVLQENPVDCLWFYICIAGAGHKIECPRIPDQTYFNPQKKTCDGAATENLCKEMDIAQLIKDEEEEAARKLSEEENMDWEDSSEKDDVPEKENMSESRVEL